MSLFFELPDPQSQGRTWRTMRISRTSPPAGCSSTTTRGAGRLVAGQVADYQFVTGWLLVASWFLAARCWLVLGLEGPASVARAFHVSLVAGPAGTWRAAWTVMRVL